MSWQVGKGEPWRCACVCVLPMEDKTEEFYHGERCYCSVIPFALALLRAIIVIGGPSECSRGQQATKTLLGKDTSVRFLEGKEGREVCAMCPVFNRCSSDDPLCVRGRAY